MPSIHVGSGGEAAAKEGITASTIATRTIRNDRATEGPSLDRCRCKGGRGTDECESNRSPPQVGSLSRTSWRMPHYPGPDLVVKCSARQKTTMSSPSLHHRRAPTTRSREADVTG